MNVSPAPRKPTSEADATIEAPLLPRRLRWLLWGVVAALLAFGAWAYNTPTMVVMWDTFLTLCGLG